MHDDIEVQEFERVVDCGRDIDCNADLSKNVVRIRRGLTPTQYVKIGLAIGNSLAPARNIAAAPIVGQVD